LHPALALLLVQTVEWVDERLLELSILLPDLVVKLDRLKADLVLQLVMDTHAVAAKLVEFRQALPAVDLSAVLAQYPRLLLDLDAAALRAQLGTLRCAAPCCAVLCCASQCCGLCADALLLCLCLWPCQREEQPGSWVWASWARLKASACPLPRAMHGAARVR
jgi:hypothetical protein